jgi:hypothetical protein
MGATTATSSTRLMRVANESGGRQSDAASGCLRRPGPLLALVHTRASNILSESVNGNLALRRRLLNAESLAILGSTWA